MNEGKTMMKYGYCMVMNDVRLLCEDDDYDVHDDLENNLEMN